MLALNVILTAPSVSDIFSNTKLNNRQIQPTTYGDIYLRVVKFTISWWIRMAIYIYVLWNLRFFDEYVWRVYLLIVKSTIFDEYVWRYSFTYCEIYDLWWIRMAIFIYILWNLRSFDEYVWRYLFTNCEITISFHEYVCRYLHTDGDIYM